MVKTTRNPFQQDTVFKKIIDRKAIQAHDGNLAETYKIRISPSELDRINTHLRGKEFQIHEFSIASYMPSRGMMRFLVQNSIRADHKNLIRASSKDLEITIQRINELEENEDEDEDENEYNEVVKPTEYATKKAIELVSKTAALIPEQFTKAWVSIEDLGGIRLTWARAGSDKQVRLLVPFTTDQQIYLYHEIGDEYGVNYNVSAKTISTWLSWFNTK